MRSDDAYILLRQGHAVVAGQQWPLKPGVPGPSMEVAAKHTEIQWQLPPHDPAALQAQPQPQASHGAHDNRQGQKSIPQKLGYEIWGGRVVGEVGVDVIGHLASAAQRHEPLDQREVVAVLEDPHLAAAPLLHCGQDFNFHDDCCQQQVNESRALFWKCRCGCD